MTEVEDVSPSSSAAEGASPIAPDDDVEKGVVDISFTAVATDDGRDGDEEHHPETTTTVSLRSVPLVELSLERITYAPATRSAGGGPGGKRKWLLGSSFGGGSVNKRRTTVLSNVSTRVSPYGLSAWMGPSGCGKTSLVSVAAGLIPDPANDLVDGSRTLINGTEGAPPKRLVGVVWQDDLLLSNLTVEETVRFAARLKCPADRSDAEVDALVDDTLSKLGLDRIRRSLIGTPGGSGRSRGISGGERKRVAVAVELVARPSILLLDEPTSGLDASTAFELMRTLKSLARLGHSIAVVIHQPRTEIYNMMDNLLLLSKGRIVYEGEPGGAREFLESCPGVKALPPETGKADWIMDVINEDEKRDGGGVLPKLWEEYRSKREHLEAQPPTDGQLRHRHSAARAAPSKRKMSRRLSSLAELEESEPKFQSSFWLQLKLLTARASRQQRGQRLTTVALGMTCAWIAFTCLAWGRMPFTTTYNHNRASLLFFLIIAQGNSVVTSSLMAFSSERRLLSRERAKKMYGVFPYFLAKTISDMVITVLMPLLYGITTYWVCNFRPTASAFFVFTLTMYLTVSTAQSFGLLFSVMIPNTAVALLMAPFLTLCLMIIGGFYIPYGLITPVLAWASWISMARYGFSTFIINEFGGRDIPCDGYYIDSGVECPMPGSAVIASYGIEGVWTSIWPNVAMLCVIQVFLRVATYAILRRSK